jgi:toxin YoeB
MPAALSDIDYFKKSGNKPLQTKIQNLIRELENNPYAGTGKPEFLKANLSGYMSRRINSEHRLIYKVYDEHRLVEVYSLRGHY